MYRQKYRYRDRCPAYLQRLEWLVVAGIFLNGCQTKELAATPRSIIYQNVTTDTMKDAADKAQVHCAQYHRDAELILGELTYGRATFRCIDR
jgi:hypothetical protein